MLRYLSKLFLDILPPVVATVLGAWIVTHYVNPKPADAPKPEAAVAEKAADKTVEKPLLRGASGMAPRAVEPVAVKPAETVPEAKPPRERAQAKAPSRAEERPREASDLARAALERLRHQAPAEAAAAPAAVPVAAPALPPPVVIAPQREARPAFGDRLTPPAEIPAGSGEAMASAEDRSLIGGIASAAKTLVEAVIPVPR